MPSNEIAKQRHAFLASIIRDSLSAQAFFGETEGSGVYLGDMPTTPSPVVSYFLQEREKLSLKSMLYLDAVSGILGEMIMLYDYGGSVDSVYLNTWKMPLFIPEEVKAHIVSAIPSMRVKARTKEEEEAIGAIKTVFDVLDMYNNEVIGSFVAYIKGEGILPDSSPVLAFKKTRRNKEAVENAFKKFIQTFVLHIDNIRTLKELITLDEVIAHFIEIKLQNFAYGLNTEEHLRIAELISHRGGSELTMLVKSGAEDEDDAGIPFSVFSSKRKAGSRTQADYLVSLDYTLLYSEAALRDEKVRETLEALYVYDTVTDSKDKKLETILDEIALIGDKYDKAYSLAVSKDVEAHKANMVQSVQMDGFLGFFSDFKEAFSKEAEEQFASLLKREAERDPDEGSLFLEEEQYGFLSAFYLIDNAFRSNIHLLPITNEGSPFKEKIREGIGTWIKEKLPTMIAEYNQARKRYLENLPEKQEEQNANSGSDKEQEAVPPDNTQPDTEKQKGEALQPKTPQDEDTIPNTNNAHPQNASAQSGNGAESGGETATFSADVDGWGYDDDDNSEEEMGVSEIETIIS